MIEDMVYSKDEEYGYTDLCSVLDDSEVGDTIYFGVPSKPCPSRFVPGADWIIEHICESAYDNCGEWAEDNVTVSPEAQKELDSLLKDWAVRNVKISFFMVEDVQSREVTAEDLE